MKILAAIMIVLGTTAALAGAGRQHATPLTTAERALVQIWADSFLRVQQITR